MFRILSIDGGGMKGIYAARMLELLVEQRPDLIKKANLIAGTSTGSILALALAAGKTPTELRKLYWREGKNIFNDSFWDDLVDLGGATGADYNHKGLRKALKRELGPNLRLRDLKTRVLVPAFDLDAPAKGARPRMWKPKFFHNFPGRGSDGRELVVDVAIRSSSAPTYFPTYQGYIDGGVVANNPSMSALAQAISPSGGKQKLTDVQLLSIGTGAEPKYIRGNKDWGWGQWARPLTSLMISGVMGVADYQVSQLLGDRYLRVNGYLSRGVDLDDTKDKTLQFLEKAAESHVRKRQNGKSPAQWLAANGW